MMSGRLKAGAKDVSTPYVLGVLLAAAKLFVHLAWVSAPVPTVQLGPHATCPLNSHVASTKRGQERQLGGVPT